MAARLHDQRGGAAYPEAVEILWWLAPAGAVTVPIYETSSAEQVQWNLSDSGAVAVVVETAAHAALLDGVRTALPELASVFQLDAGGIDALVAAGVTSILNFAPAVLQVPETVTVRKVDLSIELQVLAYHEQRRASGHEAVDEEVAG